LSNKYILIKLINEINIISEIFEDDDGKIMLNRPMKLNLFLDQSSTSVEMIPYSPFVKVIPMISKFHILFQTEAPSELVGIYKECISEDYSDDSDSYDFEDRNEPNHFNPCPSGRGV